MCASFPFFLSLLLCLELKSQGIACLEGVIAVPLDVPLDVPMDVPYGYLLLCSMSCCCTACIWLLMYTHHVQALLSIMADCNKYMEHS